MTACIGRAVLLLVIASLLPSAQANGDQYVPITVPRDGCTGGVNVITGSGQCDGGCHGVTIITGGSESCTGDDGDDNGQDGEPGCQGTTIILGGSQNCQGGDGGDGNPAGDGGAGCKGYIINLAPQNCLGGNGGNGTSGGG